MKNGVGIAEALILAVAFSAAALLLGEEGLSERRRLIAQKAKLGMELHNLTFEIRQLERRARLLRGDSGAVERAAKARLGMARADETVYVFSGGPTAPKVSGGDSSLDNRDNTP